MDRKQGRRFDEDSEMDSPLFDEISFSNSEVSFDGENPHPCDECKWFTHPSIAMESFRGEFKVPVVLRSHALVVGLHHNLLGEVMEAESVGLPIIPGKMLLWQPPLKEVPGPDHVNLGSVFLVVVVETNIKILVRVLGLPVLLEVTLQELHEVPQNDGAKLAKIMATRALCLMRLAFLPANTELPEGYEGLWKALPANVDGGRILERGEGGSLNFCILQKLKDNARACRERGPRQAFLDHLTALVSKGLMAMIDVHQQQAGIFPQNSGPLSRVYNRDECSGRVLVGPKSLLTGLDDPKQPLLRLRVYKSDNKYLLQAIDHPYLRMVRMKWEFIMARVFLVKKNSQMSLEEPLRGWAELLRNLQNLHDLTKALRLPPMRSALPPP